MNTPPSRKAPSQAQLGAASSLPEPRGKLEFMFRAMLVEAQQITDRSETLIKQLNAAAMQMQTMPAVMRKAVSLVQEQTASSVVREIQDAARTVSDARRGLQRATQTLETQRGRSVWGIAIAAALCGLAGGLVAALFVLWALK